MNNASFSLEEYLNASPTMFHAVINAKKELKSFGAIELNEGDSFCLEAGKSYFYTRNDSCLVAFTVGKKAPWETGLRISVSHTDSPALKIKNLELNIDKNYARIPIELYGSPIISSWIDRSLSIAGKIYTKTQNGIEAHFVNESESLASIPNLAIHLNRELNKGFEYNAQNHLQALYCALSKGTVPQKNALIKKLCASLKIESESVISHDLYFYDTQKAFTFGSENELVSSGRLDNLASCYALLKAFTLKKNEDFTSVIVMYNHEEIGSNTREGADSLFLNSVVERLVSSIFKIDAEIQNPKNAAAKAFPFLSELVMRTEAKSFIISSDSAQSFHPSYPEKFDAEFSPLLNAGLAIKKNGNMRYATNALSEAYVKALCLEAKIDFQQYMARSDSSPGSTVGTMVSALSGIKTVDVGLPLLAMHSVRETAGVKDLESLVELLNVFYSNDTIYS